MAAENKTPEQQIRAKAAACFDGIPARWVYIPLGKIEVDDRDLECSVGEIYYENKMFEFTVPIRIRDWVFCSERMKGPGGPFKWMLGAFYGNSHYTFGPQDGLNEPLKYIGMVLGQFLSILYPDVLDGKPVDHRMPPGPDSQRYFDFKLPEIMSSTAVSNEDWKKIQEQALAEPGQPRILFGGGAGRPRLDVTYMFSK